MAATATPPYYMPIIAPPATGNSYPSPDITVTPTGNNLLTIQLGDPAVAHLFAMGTGKVLFIPGGTALPAPLGDTSLGEGSLILDLINPPTAKVLPPGLPPITRAIYLDVQAATVRTSLRRRVEDLAEPQLRQGLKTVGITPPAAASIAD